VYFVK